MTNYGSTNIVDEVWKKGHILKGYDSNVYRQDDLGTTIKKDEYGKLSDYGWQIDHIKPQSQGGSDDISNLRPLHHVNNRNKSDGRLKPSQKP